VKLLLIFSLIVTTNVMASKARILALGEDVEDLYFVEDARSIFVNSSYIHNYVGRVTMEFGDDGYTAASGIFEDDENPKAIGGFIMNCQQYVCGLFVGEESNTLGAINVISTDIAETGGAALKVVDNTVDILIGKEADVKWAFNLGYGAYKEKDSNGKEAKVDDLGFRLGFMANNWEAYLNAGLMGSSEADEGVDLGGGAITAKQKFEGKYGAQFGGAYKFSGNRKAYLTVKTMAWDETSGSKKDEVSYFHYIAGYGKFYEMSKDSLVFARLTIDNLKVDFERGGASNGEFQNLLVPIVIGFEKEVNSWLTLRGSVSQYIYGVAKGKNLSTYLDPAGTGVLHQTVAESYHVWDSGASAYLEGEKTIANTTTVNAGASFHLGNLEIDGFIGTTDG
jgi:hypothetical protein